ncbi:MAG: cvpA [Moraxellaceae bacterium]|jgi:membrane protein required for colicin V production|nr:cvpA [Moraxellaceae bacterium]
MHPADGVILALIAISTLFGVFRGFTREAFAVAGWVAAYIVARVFHPTLDLMLVDVITTPSLRMATAWGGLFITTLLLAALAGYMVRSLMEAAGISSVDRLLGGVFGLVRGAILVLALLVMLAPALSRDNWWHEATLPGAFMRYEATGRALKQKLVEAARSAAGDKPAPRDEGAAAGRQP